MDLIKSKLFLYLSNIKAKFFTGHHRTVAVIKNIVASFFLKGTNILISFALVPLCLGFIDTTRFGIWLTISTIIGWIDYFDIGLGSGLRNKFAEAIAKGEKKLARSYVSTTYALFGIIVMLAIVFFLFANLFLNWTKIINAPVEMSNELNTLVIIVFITFSLRFVFKLIGTILAADQKIAISNSFNVLGNLLSLITIYFLTKFSSGSLVLLGAALTIPPLLILLIASIVLFNGKYKIYKPSFRYINFKYNKELASLGLKFFVLQMGTLVLFTTDNLIITRLFGPSYVTSYTIAYRYFNIIILLSTIIMSTLWSSYTDAYAKKDFSWIKKIIKSNIRIWLVFVLIAVILLIFSNYFYLFWVGESIKIPFLLSLNMFIFVIVWSFVSIFFHFLVGVGKVKLCVYQISIQAIINIPLSIFLALNLNFGLSGVIMATWIGNILSLILMPIQYFKIINNKDQNIWGE